MSWTFNPPPGWPPQPDGWLPPPGWAPDPRWPPAPAGWQFWVAGGERAATGTDSGAAGTGSGQAWSPAAEPREATPAEAGSYWPAQGSYPAPQGGSYPPAQAGSYPPAQGSYPPARAGSYPPAQASPYPPAQAGPYPPAQAGPYPPAQAGPYPPAQASPYPPAQASPYPPAKAGSYPLGQAGPFAPAVAGAPSPDDQPAAASASRPWFTRWWAIVGLIALLVIGSAIGFGGTRVAMELSSDDDPATTDGAGRPGGGGPAGDPEPAAAAQGTPVASEAPEPTPSSRLVLPTISPPSIEGAAGELCADVALIMITMVTATADAEDFEAYPDTVVEARRTAAGELRSLAEDTDIEPDRAALAEFAGEVDASAQMVEDDPGNQGTFEDSFDRVSDAYQTFTDDNC